MTAAVATEPDVIELIGAYRAGDIASRDQLVDKYLPLVRSIASRYAGRGEPLEDLVQVGSIGLVLAIERFDVDRGVKFTTYAVPTIVGEIQRHFRDRAWAIHVPRRMKELSLKLTRAIEALTADLGRSPTIAELAEEAGLEEEEVVEALETYNAYSTRSLSQPLGLGDSDEGTVEDLFGGPDAGYDEVENGALLESGLVCARRAGADDRRAPVLRGADPVGDRGAYRHLADARLAAAAPLACGHARPARGRRHGAGARERDRQADDPGQGRLPRPRRLVLSGIAMQTPMSEIELADLKLAVTEVCGNAVQHAVTEAPGVVRVVFRVEPDAIEVSVEDEGAGAAFPDVDEEAVIEEAGRERHGPRDRAGRDGRGVIEDGSSAHGHRRPHAQAPGRLAVLASLPRGSARRRAQRRGS